MACARDPRLFDLGQNGTRSFLEALHSFKWAYGLVHKHLAFCLCVLGLLANGVHVTVLRRRQMRSSSVHTTLTCIALADMGTMTSYLVYITRFELLRDPTGYAYGWALFLQSHAMLSIALHALSIYLVTLMAFLRLMAMSAGRSHWMRPKQALTASVGVALFVLVICAPTFFAHSVIRNEFDKYNVGISVDLYESGCSLLKLNLWLTGIMLKAVPCFLLMCFTFALLRRLRANERKREMLLRGIDKTQRTRRSSSDRITYMLLLMVFVFLVTELPQGIFAVLNAIFTYQFQNYVYIYVADLLDLLSLINCYVCFCVYIITSSTYRQTLWRLLPCRK